MRRLLWLVWDGASAPLVERLLAAGDLPNLARLCGNGFRAAARPGWPCAQTPPAVATLFTGAPAHIHGAYGFREAARPRSAHAITAAVSGFDTTHLRAETLWHATARAGGTSMIVCAPFCGPVAAFAGTKVSSFDGYGTPLARQSVHRASELAKGPPPIPPAGVRDADFRRDTIEGYRVLLSLGGAPVSMALGVDRASGGLRAWASIDAGPAVALAPGSPVPLRTSPTAGFHVVLFDDGSDFLLFCSSAWDLRATEEQRASDLVDAAGPFLGEGGRHAYSKGELGPSIRNGGSGVAEERLTALLHASAQWAATATRHVLATDHADLTILYAPCIDEISHVLFDLADPDAGSAAGTRAFAVLREAYRLADHHLGIVLDAAGQDAIVAVASDHGHQGVRWTFRPNVLLRERGLLASRASDGELDLASTSVMYGPGANGYLLVNAVDRPGGIVARERVDDVLRATATLLMGASAPDGTPLVLAVHRAGETAKRGTIPGDEAGDAFLLAAAGVAVSASLEGAVVERGEGSQHTQAVDDVTLDAFFAVGGASVPPRGRLPERIELVDVAPTLAALAEIPRPFDACGRSLI